MEMASSDSDHSISPTVRGDCVVVQHIMDVHWFERPPNRLRPKLNR
jgi:hypothetical protein